MGSSPSWRISPLASVHLIANIWSFDHSVAVIQNDSLNMPQEFSLVWTPPRILSWQSALIGIVVIKVVLSLAVTPGSFLVSYSGISYLLLLILGTCFAVRNGIQNTLGGRTFWTFLAIAYGLWTLHQFIGLYYELGLHVEVPNDSIADSLLFLHIVPLMAAVATLPHRNATDRKLTRNVLDSLLLLFFWTFLYGYIVFPYQYLYSIPSYAIRFDIIYLIENAALVLGAGILSFRMEAPWKRIYLHLMGASALYTLSSTFANLAIDSAGYINGRLYGLGLTAAVCWSVWIPLQARQIEESEITAGRRDASGSQSSVWAMVAVVMISGPIVWELLARNENAGLRTFRLLTAVCTVVCLASAAYIKEYLARRELASQMEHAISSMSRKLIESQEQERARIGRELHDDINQRLAMLGVEIERLQGDPSEIQKRVKELRQQTAEISNDVQALSHELHASKLEYLGVVGGIRSWCREFGERQGLEINFKTDIAGRIPVEIGLTLFRVLQEGLHNAVKHSEVKRIEVQLSEQSNDIHLTISDAGKGFDVDAAKQGRGLGLTSMEERVRLMNGAIAIDSKPLCGTKIHVCLPLTLEQCAQRSVG
jgi:signal transduction histidine kinase